MDSSTLFSENRKGYFVRCIHQLACGKVAIIVVKMPELRIIKSFGFSTNGEENIKRFLKTDDVLMSKVSSFGGWDNVEL